MSGRNNTPNRHVGCGSSFRPLVLCPNLIPHFSGRRRRQGRNICRKVTLLRENLRNKSITYNWHDPETSFLEAALSRGDRRVADVIEQAWRHGAKFDSWSEYFSLQTWLDAFAACGLSPAFLCQPYTGQGRDLTLADHFRRRKGELSLEGAGDCVCRSDYPGLPGEMFRLRCKPAV